MPYEKVREFHQAWANAKNAVYRQRRFWAHLLCDQDNLNNHLDYIHWNPVKHGRVQKVADWPRSSFHRFVDLGIYPVNWGHSGDFSIHANE